MENMLVTEVFSFTKNQSYTVCVSKDYLLPGDKVLFIDDFLANGNAGKGMIDLVNQAGAEMVGMGFLIEKAFQKGGELLRQTGKCNFIFSGHLRFTIINFFSAIILSF